jgi:hypothetical protein
VVGLAALGLTMTAIALARDQGPDPAQSALPAPPRPAFAIPRPEALRPSAHASHWAPVLHAVDVRATPRLDSPTVARLAAETPERTTNIVRVLGRSRDPQGTIWMRVRAPSLPDNVEGWVRRTALGGYTLVDTRLVVDLDAHRATLYEDGEPVFEAPIGIGKPESPTPRGEFYVRNVLTSYRSPFYGPIAFGTSARSPVLTDWPAGGFVGIHGTSRPELLPGEVSHGCIRMRNNDILRLAELMPVGTPITIR